MYTFRFHQISIFDICIIRVRLHLWGIYQGLMIKCCWSNCWCTCVGARCWVAEAVWQPKNWRGRQFGRTLGLNLIFSRLCFVESFKNRWVMFVYVLRFMIVISCFFSGLKQLCLPQRLYIRNPLDEAARSCVSGSTSLECDALMIFDVRPRNLAWIKKTACRNVSRERKRETHLIILVNTSIYKLEMMAWKKVWYFNCCYFSNFHRSGMFHIIFRLGTSSPVPASLPPRDFSRSSCESSGGNIPGWMGEKFHGTQEICWRLSEESCPNSRKLRVFLEKWV